MITEIGALVKIVKDLVDASNGARGFLGSGKLDPKLLSDLRRRISGLSDQIWACAQLGTQLPEWRRLLSEVDHRANKLNAADAAEVERRLDQIVHSARSDQFSGVFYSHIYKGMPKIEEKLSIFKAEIDSLYALVTNTPTGDAAAWSKQWPQLKTRLQQLHRTTSDVGLAQQATMADLIKELHNAGEGLGQ